MIQLRQRKISQINIFTCIFKQYTVANKSFFLFKSIINWPSWFWYSDWYTTRLCSFITAALNVVSRRALILPVFSWKRDHASYLSQTLRVKCWDEVTIGTSANLSSSYLNKCRYKSNYRLGGAMSGGYENISISSSLNY